MCSELRARAERKDVSVALISQCFIAPRALATSGRRPGVRAKRAARGVAGHQVWTGTHEKRQSHNSDAKRYWTSTSSYKLITKRYSLFLYPVKESHFCEPESFFRLTKYDH